MRRVIRRLSTFAGFAVLVAYSVGCAPATEEEGDATGSAVYGGVDMHGAELDAVGALVRSNGAYCTGTLIAPKIVLTAKHCGDGGNSFVVGPDAYRPKRTVAVKRTLKTPAGDDGMTNRGVDAQVHVLAEAIDGVRPLAFARGPIDRGAIGRELVVIGYGKQENTWQDAIEGTRMGAKTKLFAIEGKPFKQMFPEVGDWLDRWTELEGAEFVSTRRKMLDGYYDFELLAGYEALVASRDGSQACLGDSGGPLLRYVDGKPVVVGILSGAPGGATHACVIGSVYTMLGPAVQALIDEAKSPCEGIPEAGLCEDDAVVHCKVEGGIAKKTTESCAGKDRYCSTSGPRPACASR